MSAVPSCPLEKLFQTIRKFHKKLPWQRNLCFQKRFFWNICNKFIFLMFFLNWINIFFVSLAFWHFYINWVNFLHLSRRHLKRAAFVILFKNRWEVEYFKFKSVIYKVFQIVDNKFNTVFKDFWLVCYLMSRFFR